jgi:hypothetical protein
MMTALANAGRFAVLVLVAAAIAALSDAPEHRSLPEGLAVLTLSFGHGADRKTACRPATQEELSAMPPNMRRTEICPRRRPPIRVELDIDGRAAFHADVPPSGIAGDGPSRVHESFTLPAGSHRLDLRLRDRPGDGFDWQASRTIDIAAADRRVVDFRPEAGGFVFH